MRELVSDQIPAEKWDQFVKEFRGYRYDQVRGTYYSYEQVLHDSFERICNRWGLNPNPPADFSRIQSLAEAGRPCGARM